MSIHTGYPEHNAQPANQYPCLCAAVRKAGRVLTQKYDRYLKPSDLKVTQFSMLANISRNPGLSVSELAKLLWMDQTTVTRNLQVLEKSNYIKFLPEEMDQRIKRIKITNTGKSKMDEAKPLWDQAQAEMEQLLGIEQIDKLLAGFKKIAG